MQLSPEVLNMTMALPPAERAALAHHLLLSLEPPEVADDPSVWENELAARLDEVESGSFSAKEASVAMADMRRALEQRRHS